MRVNATQRLINKWEDFVQNMCHRVADVTLIVQDRGLLRRLVRLAPVEARVPTLQRKLEIAKVTQKTWRSAEKRLEQAQEKALKHQQEVDKIAAERLKPSETTLNSPLLARHASTTGLLSALSL